MDHQLREYHEVSSLLELLSSPSPLSLSLSLYLHTCYCHRRDPSVSLSLRCYRLSFSVTTARSHRPLVWAGLGWFGQFPLQSWVLGGELAPRWIFILWVWWQPRALVTGLHWGSRQFTMKQVPSHRLSGELTEEIKINIRAQGLM